MIEFIVVYLIGGIATTFIMSLLDEKDREEAYIRAGMFWPVTWLLAMFCLPAYLGQKLRKHGVEQDNKRQRKIER
mgnify:CR=1 FL=1